MSEIPHTYNPAQQIYLLHDFQIHLFYQSYLHTFSPNSLDPKGQPLLC